MWMGLFAKKCIFTQRKKNLHLWNSLHQAAWNENTQLEKATEYTAEKKEIIGPLHGLDIEADPSAHSFVPWIPRAFLPLSPWDFCNLFELLRLPTSLSLSHCSPPALALQSTLLAFIFFYSDHCLSPCPQRGLRISTPVHWNQALVSGLELAVLSWALRTEITRGSWYSRVSHIGQEIGKNKKIGASKISPLSKTWIPFGNLDSHPYII